MIRDIDNEIEVKNVRRWNNQNDYSDVYDDEERRNDAMDGDLSGEKKETDLVDDDNDMLDNEGSWGHVD